MPLREFTDAAGRVWNVWDVDPDTVRGHPARTSGSFDPPAWLAFECPATGERRRLVPIPADWFSGSEERLRALCHRAEVFARQAAG